MRLCLVLAASAVCTLSMSAPLVSAQTSADDALTNEDTPSDAISADDELQDRQFNRWVCIAESSRGRRFTGESDWFEAGSGRGRAAHQEAHSRALERCRRANFARSCRSDFQSECRVERRSER